MGNAQAPILLEATNITKSFPGVVALRGVDFAVTAGEIHALVGENGAGKSTLINILTGTYPATAGEVSLRGKKVRLHSPADARAQGIAVLHQHPQLVGSLDVAGNLFLGREPATRLLRRVRQKEMQKQTGEMLARLGLQSITPTTFARSLDVGEIQMVAICRALLQEPGIFILDEPTASLGKDEVDRLFGVLRRMKNEGVGILYISHRMEEVFDLADRITVMRNGEIVGTKDVDETTVADVIQMMIGKRLRVTGQARERAFGDVYLKANGITGKTLIKDVSFAVQRGMALGVFGVRGAGQHELALALSGAAPIVSGTLEIRNRTTRLNAPANALSVAKLGYVPSDRHAEGLILNMSVRENITLPILRRLSRLAWVSRRRERKIARDGIEALSVSCSGLQQRLMFLSGGNQQKVVLAKWFLSGANLYVLEDPTKGIDVGTKEEIYKAIHRLLADGAAVILITSELREIMNLTDRVLVFRSGKVVFESETSRTSTEELLQYAMGGVDDTRVTNDGQSPDGREGSS